MKQNSASRKSGQRTKMVAWLAIAVLIAAVVAGAKAYRFFGLPYDGEEPVRVYIDGRGGATAMADSIGSRTNETFGRRVADVWQKAFSKGQLRSGSYVIQPGEKAWELARCIRNRQQDPVRVTFNNLRTFDQLAARVSQQMVFSTDDFKAAADSVLKARNVKRESYPAYFLPDTYEFYWSDPAMKVVGRFVDAHDRFWNDERTAKAAAMGLTPEKVSTLASIVEEETAKADERPKVARLYLNRLNRGMKLQADPTVKFAVGDFSLKRITNNHLSTPSRYNTYIYQGLPPGPIRIPAASTLDAVLQAPQHNYIYMCAKEDFSGYHNFAADYATHSANAKRYHNALNRRGIK